MDSADYKKGDYAAIARGQKSPFIIPVSPKAQKPPEHKDAPQGWERMETQEFKRRMSELWQWLDDFKKCQ